MKATTLLFFLSLLIASCGEEPTTEREPSPTLAFKDSLDTFLQQPAVPEDVVFINVNVIPMTTETVLTGQDVFISNGSIESISATGVATTNGYEEIDGTGKYLIPGLADMHTHPVVSADLPSDLFLFLANGVTTLRVMWGFDGHVSTRDQINAGDLVGPKMYVASAGFDGANRTWPGAINTASVEDVKSQIDQFSNKNYDFIKVYSGITADEYEELVDYAWSKGIPPIGHIPGAVDASDALSKHHSISHLGKWRSSLLPDNELFALTAQSTTYICPTLTVINRIQSQQESYKDQWYDLVSPAARGFYNQTENTMLQDNSWYLTISGVLGDLHDAGAKIIAGTDQGIRLIMPGASLHEELRYYVFSGMTNYEALQTATTNPAQFLENDAAGSVTVGGEADLVLLNSNPLDNIGSLSNIAGVMSKGDFMSKEEIDQVLSWIRGYYGR